jgi:RNA polymerase sigma-B factor
VTTSRAGIDRPHATPPEGPVGGSRAGIARTRRLVRRYKRTGDPHARDEILRSHMPLAAQLARRHARRGQPMDDLLQVALIGLMKAIDRFDLARGTAFTTFAVPTIVGELRRHLRDNGWDLHLPRSLQERVLRVDAAVTRLSRRTGRSPSPDQIAADIGESVELVLEALEAGASAADTLSLDATPPGQEEGSTLVDLLPVEDDGYRAVMSDLSFARVLRVLPRHDRPAVVLRFMQNLSQTEIARRTGMSQMQVSRILRRSADRLQVALRDQQAA